MEAPLSLFITFFLAFARSLIAPFAYYRRGLSVNNIYFLSKHFPTLKNKFWVILISIAVGLLLGLWLAPQRPASVTQSLQSDPVALKTQWLSNVVSKYYVDDVLDNDSLVDAMFNGMLLALDPHSRYLNADELRRESESLEGNFQGAGIVLHFLHDSVTVAQILPNGPSANSGILPGDCILAVNGKKVSGVKMDNTDVVKLIRGPQGTSVKLSILRFGRPEPLSFSIRRDVVLTPTVSYAGMVDASTGYVRLTQFGQSTANEVETALSKLKRQGMRRLIFDLRGNGGGMLDAAISVADQFLPSGCLIVSTKGRHKRSNDDQYASSGGLFEQGSLVVLIDEYSASASEIVAGAIQDNDRGLVLGRRSFGKGLVQREFPLPDGTAVFLTIARYYTPSGRCIQRPYNKGSDDYYDSFVQNLIDAPTTTSDSAYRASLLHVDSAQRFTTSKGRTVFGGGGITPDVILPYKTDSLSLAFNRWVNTAKPYDLANDFVVRHASDIIARYHSPSDFANNFSLPPQLVDKALAHTRFSPAYRSRALLLLRAYIGQYFWGDDLFYRLYLSVDNDVQRALKYAYR